MTLILVAVFGVGVATHVATASLGAQLALRLGLAVTAAYAAFFVLVRLWLWAVAETRQPDIDPVSEVAEESVDVAVDGLLDGPSSARHAVDLDGPSGGGGSGGALDALDGLGELPVLLILGLVLGLIIGAVLLVWNAPAILGEAAFELALVTMLGPRARSLGRPGWTGSVLRATALPYALMLLVAVGVGLGAHAYCPEALRLRDVLHCGG